MRTLLATAVLVPAVLHAQPRKPPLTAREIDAIARLTMLEDRRTLDSAQIAPLLADAHPEVRRRAALAVARIIDKRGLALLRIRPLDADTSVAATTVFAVGQQKDTSTTAWLDSILASPKSAPTVATEAAAALGKLKSSAARAALARFLSSATNDARTRDAIGEALLAIGRTPRGDIAPVVRWTTSADEEIRWRATWALFRQRDPAALPTLRTLARDRSALVRSWAIRGFTRQQADTAGITAAAESLLVAASADRDRRVRTEAMRALGTYDDSLATSALVAASGDRDAWIAVTALEGLARRSDSSARAALGAATSPSRSCAVRATALAGLLTAGPQGSVPHAAGGIAESVATDSTPYCRLIGSQAYWTLRDAAATPDARRAARRTEIASMDAATRAGAIRAMSSWADTTDLAWLREQRDRARSESASFAIAATNGAIASVERRAGIPRAAPAARPERPLGEYRALVERWVVPDYNGAPKPRAIWDSPRGQMEIELYPGDALLSTDAFVKLVESGAVVGTDFTRVVPDFVDQQRPVIEGSLPQRDEVNRKRLTRGNLAWATAGLDTGSPGYTLNHTPQPHNEGDFTSMGRVVRGMEAVDRIELGDRITGARMIRR